MTTCGGIGTEVTDEFRLRNRNKKKVRMNGMRKQSSWWLNRWIVIQFERRALLSLITLYGNFENGPRSKRQTNGSDQLTVLSTLTPSKETVRFELLSQQISPRTRPAFDQIYTEPITMD